MLLDDHLLCCANDGMNASPSLRSSNGRDLWIRLLEKAFVKSTACVRITDIRYYGSARLPVRRRRRRGWYACATRTVGDPTLGGTGESGRRCGTGGGGDDAVDRFLDENRCFVRCDSTGRVTWRHGSGDANNGPLVDGDDDGIFFMGFATFRRFFPIVTLVGPLTPPRRDVHPSSADGDSRHVPDCVHSVKGNLSCVREILAVSRNGLR
ncbi:hypothetical protein ACHAW5_008503 [Stephanodiscus triporus]|uniref:Uncharacterized protein n=1 Tax=Stephanodiscus triporus TaxID=2934178 RepID=A0ABD3MJ29_9STRA